MKNNHLLDKIRPWLEKEMGASLDRMGHPSAALLATAPRSSSRRRIWAVRVQGQALVTAPENWLEGLHPVVDNLEVDELFTVFGSYELSRITLPLGTGVFGPTWYLAADEGSFRAAADVRPTPVSSQKLEKTFDASMFWHCSLRRADSAHAVFEEGLPVALATTQLLGNRVFEIGVDVAPEAKSRGLGRAVVSAAGRWILEQGGLIVAGAAPWNVPSVRTLRSLGLRLVFTDMDAMPAPFRQPPQPLGAPYPGAPMYDYYPVWATNSEIQTLDE